MAGLSKPPQQLQAGLRHNTVVKLKGLPYKAVVEDVLQFFASFSLQQDKVLFKLKPDGRPSGEVRFIQLSR